MILPVLVAMLALLLSYLPLSAERDVYGNYCIFSPDFLLISFRFGNASVESLHAHTKKTSSVVQDMT